MKTLRKFLPAGLLLAIFTSCGEGRQTSESRDTEKQQDSCLWMYDAEQTKVMWTAYKFTEMTGVGGSFDIVHVSGGGNSIKRHEVMNGAGFHIPVSSVNTVNPDRDMKIRTFFFGSLAKGGDIEGKVLRTEGSEEEGKVFVQLVFNETEREIGLDYTFSGDTLIATGEVNVNDWNAGAGISALNKECYDLHKGADGKSMLHPTVQVEIRSLLKRQCP